MLRFKAQATPTSVRSNTILAHSIWRLFVKPIAGVELTCGLLSVHLQLPARCGLQADHIRIARRSGNTAQLINGKTQIPQALRRTCWTRLGRSSRHHVTMIIPCTILDLLILGLDAISYLCHCSEVKRRASHTSVFTRRDPTCVRWHKGICVDGDHMIQDTWHRFPDPCKIEVCVVCQVEDGRLVSLSSVAKKQHCLRWVGRRCLE
mmetsp:Transcript_65413/g.123843  ORF Transcript_65413/g.123843 Transcript_65413/m.123843 type:complete len:206 (-) Transcript_65413:522-1139(-)